MNGSKISTPKNSAAVTEAGKTYLTWSSGFSSKWSGQYSQAQIFVDTQVLALSEPYIPMQTMTLIKSGNEGNSVGSGEVSWTAPYAKIQYYNTSESRSYDPLRGGRWFERMKADNGAAIIAKAKKIAGGGK